VTDVHVGNVLNCERELTTVYLTYLLTYCLQRYATATRQQDRAVLPSTVDQYGTIYQRFCEY